MAAHLLTETQVPEIQAKLAEYYGNGIVADSLNQSAALPRADMGPQIAKALRIDPTRALSESEVANLLTGLRADGQQIAGKQVQASTKDRTRIAYADFTLSAPKSFSVALALAPTEAERAMLDRAHRKAAEWTMNHIAEQIGLSRKGKGGKDGYDQAHVAWIQFDHYTARPTVKVPVVENGIATTELLTVKVAGDPQRHTHFIIPNAVISKADGRTTSFFQDRIRGRVHEWGSIYQARLGVELRAHGVEWELDSDTTKSMNQRMGRLTSVPRSISDLFSKRTHDGEEAARDYASRAGADWDNMSDSAKIKFMKGGTAKARRSKQDDLADYNSWLNQAAAANYQHRSVLRPGEKQDKMSREQRLESVYATSLPILEPETERRSTFDGSIARIAAAKGFIEHGIESADEINLITRSYRTEGIRQNGEATKLIWGKANNDQFASFTTAIHVDQENEAIGLLRSAGQDRTSALSREQIEAAIERAMKADPKLDFTKDHGLLQRDLIHSLGSGGRAAVGIGVAGSGKTTILKPLIDAWHEDGRTTFGVTLAWRQSHALADAGVGRGSQKEPQRALQRGRQKGRRMEPDARDLKEAGIGRDHSMALTGFLHRAKAGMLKLDDKTVLIIDEIAQVGTRQVLELARLRAQHKFQIVGLGDQFQCQSIEAGSTIRLFQKALGEGQVPELLNTVRQATERDRETAMMFRKEQSAEALARKEEDGTLIIASGGYQQAIQAAVNLLMQRRQENASNPKYTVAISAPTNADVMAIGAEVRRRRQMAGEVGPDAVTIDASDQSKGRYSLALAEGDRLRLFSRVKDGRGHFGDNGSVVEVIAIHPASGLTLRNEKGRVAVVNWEKLRHKATGLVQLAYGDALTVDARQGDTVHEHITVMPSGSAAVNGFKAYASESRHRIRSWIVGSEGEEMMEIISRRPLGDPRNILDTPSQVREAVIANMARNLNRHPEKELATDFLSKARNVREGEVDSRQTAWHRREVRAPAKPKKQTKARRRHAAKAAEQAAKPTPIAQKKQSPAQAQTPAGDAASEPTPVRPSPTTTLSAHAGWKLHLNVAPSTDNARTRNIAEWLADEGIHFKVGQSGDQDGKGMTVYVGGYAKARDLADELEARFVLPEAAALAEDVRWSPCVNARFDAAGDKDFHQYGVGGVPMLMRHVQDGYGTPDNGFNVRHAAEAEAVLVARYGALYGPSCHGAQPSTEQKPAQATQTPAQAAQRPAANPTAPNLRKAPRAATPASKTAQQEAPKMSPVEIQAEFARHLESIGLRLSGPPKMDGRKHTVAVRGNKGSRKSGFYRGFADGRSTSIGHNSLSGETSRWKPTGTIGNMTAEQRLRQAEADRAARVERQREQAARESSGAMEAKALWKAARKADGNHPYLKNKAMDGQGLRQAAPDQTAVMNDGKEIKIGGRLVAPLRDIDGKIWNVQIIGADGRKTFLPGRKKGLFVAMGRSGPTDPVILTEGLATGKTIRELSGLSTVAAIDSGNLGIVARAIRAKYPDKPIIIAGDNDHHLPLRKPALPNVGAEKSKEAANAVGGTAILPKFEPGEAGTDWNDLRVKLGPEAARRAWEEAVKAEGLDLPKVTEEEGNNVRITQDMRDAARGAAQTTRPGDEASRHRRDSDRREEQRDFER